MRALKIEIKLKYVRIREFGNSLLGMTTVEYILKTLAWTPATTRSCIQYSFY